MTTYVTVSFILIAIGIILVSTILCVPIILGIDYLVCRKNVYIRSFNECNSKYYFTEEEELV